MSGKSRGSENYGFMDVLIIIVFITIAVFGIDMFRYDFLRAVKLRNVEPAGTVVIKKNTVQRRLADRALWDRLAGRSPVYLGDLIRVAEISAATLYIDDHSIDLDENTLIRINRTDDSEDLRLELNAGTLSLATGSEGKNVSLELNGSEIRAGAGTALSAATDGTGGVSVQINEGSAQIVGADGAVREISSGSSITVGADGKERSVKSAVVTNPLPNARYVKQTKEPMTINFSWKRINLATDERLRMEIASDKNFTRVSDVMENLDAQATARFDTGLWHWRLLSGKTVLTAGRITIADGSPLELQSPAFNSVFHYGDKPLHLNFQWAEVQDAVSYIIEVSGVSDFSDIKISRQSSVSSVTDSSFGEGSWFWRVKPIFPPVFIGDAVFSTPSFFRVERASAEMAGEVDMSTWLAGQTRSDELPPDVPREIIPQHLVKTADTLPDLPPLLPPRNLQPAKGTVFGLPYFRTQRTMVFSWSAVRDANAYIFTIYQQTATGKRQVLRQTINGNPRYTLTNLQLLDRGDFVWQVEAVDMERGGAIQRRGAAAENTFTIDIPRSSPLQVEDSGVLYGD